MANGAAIPDGSAAPPPGRGQAPRGVQDHPGAAPSMKASAAMLMVMSPSRRIASASASASGSCGLVVDLPGQPDPGRRVLAADPQHRVGVVGRGRDRAGVERRHRRQRDRVEPSRSYWHSTDTVVPASAAAMPSSKSGSCSIPVTGRSAQLMSTATRRPGNPCCLAGRHLPAQPSHRATGAERLPGQQRPSHPAAVICPAASAGSTAIPRRASSERGLPRSPRR